MKKTTLAALLAAALTSTSALAVSDNTITFKGEVTDETCSLAVNGNTARPVILLPTVSTSDLAAAADTAGTITFDIGVTGCTGDKDAITTISTVFVGNQVTNNGNLGNTGTASNVEIQILNTEGTAISLTGGYTGEGDLTLAKGATEATATYSARYYATGAATAGTVESTLQYAVSYQ